MVANLPATITVPSEHQYVGGVGVTSQGDTIIVIVRKIDEDNVGIYDGSDWIKVNAPRPPNRIPAHLGALYKTNDDNNGLVKVWGSQAAPSAYSGIIEPQQNGYSLGYAFDSIGGGWFYIKWVGSRSTGAAVRHSTKTVTGASFRRSSTLVEGLAFNEADDVLYILRPPNVIVYSVTRDASGNPTLIEGDSVAVPGAGTTARGLAYWPHPTPKLVVGWEADGRGVVIMDPPGNPTVPEVPVTPAVEVASRLCLVQSGGSISDRLDNVPAAAANAKMAITTTEPTVDNLDFGLVAGGTRYFRRVPVLVGKLLATDTDDGAKRAFYAATVPDDLDCADFDLGTEYSTDDYELVQGVFWHDSQNCFHLVGGLVGNQQFSWQGAVSGGYDFDLFPAGGVVTVVAGGTTHTGIIGEPIAPTSAADFYVAFVEFTPPLEGLAGDWTSVAGPYAAPGKCSEGPVVRGEGPKEEPIAMFEYWDTNTQTWVNDISNATGCLVENNAEFGLHLVSFARATTTTLARTRFAVKNDGTLFEYRVGSVDSGDAKWSRGTYNDLVSNNLMSLVTGADDASALQLPVLASNDVNVDSSLGQQYLTKLSGRTRIFLRRNAPASVSALQRSDGP